MQRLKMVGLIVVALLLLVIALQNTEPVTTAILGANVEMPRAVLLLVSLASGYVLGFAHCLLRSRKKVKKA